VNPLNEGALILASMIRFFTAMAALARWFGLPIQKIIGFMIRHFFIPDSRMLGLIKSGKRENGVAEAISFGTKSRDFPAGELSLNFITMKTSTSYAPFFFGYDLSGQKQVEEE